MFAFTMLMLRQTSWFYKEIISWYKDILDGHLLNNFTLRRELTKKTMFRNDFRFSLYRIKTCTSSVGSLLI